MKIILLSSLLFLNQSLIPFSETYDKIVQIDKRQTIWSKYVFLEFIDLKSEDGDFSIMFQTNHDDCDENYKEFITVRWRGLEFYSENFSFYFKSPPNNYRLKINFNK